VDAKSYWLYTNDPYDNRKRKEAFDTYGFEKGLEVLAGQSHENACDWFIFWIFIVPVLPDLSLSSHFLRLSYLRSTSL